MQMKGRSEILAATFLAIMVLEVAASPSPYAGFAVDDVRRPVYRGNLRYKIHSVNNLETSNNPNMKSNSFPNISYVSSNEMPFNSSLSRDSNNQRFRRSSFEENEKIAKLQGTESSFGGEVMENENWDLIPLMPSIEESNHTKSLVQNFFKNTLRILKNPVVPDDELRSVSSSTNRPESLDKLILSHTGGQRPIQMYPEGSPPDWTGKPSDPHVILIEDVHPSKLPKPDGHWSSYHHHSVAKPISPSSSWTKPNVGNYGSKPSHINYKPPPSPTPSVIIVENVITSQPPLNENQWGGYHPTQTNYFTSTPKPTTEYPYHPSRPQYPVSNEVDYQPITIQTKPHYKPPYYSGSSVVHQVGLNKPQHTQPKPITVKPVFLHPKPLKPIKRPTVQESYRPAILQEIQITTQTNGWSKPTVVFQSTQTTTHRPKPIHSNPTKPPIYHKPVPVFYPPSVNEPEHKPVYVYPHPEPSPEPPPKPHVPIHPPLNESPRPPEAPYRDPPIKPHHPLGSTIIVSQTTALPPITPVPSRPPPPSIVILEAEQEQPVTEDCGTVHIINEGIKTPKECSDILVLLNSPLAVAGGGSTAAAGGSGSSVIAGAAAAAAAAAGAGLTAGAAGAASVGAAASGIVSGAVSNLGGVRPGIPTRPTTTVTPILHPLEDETSSEEDYDYEDSDENPPIVATTARPPNRRPSAMTFYDYLTSSLPIMGPVGVSLWVIVLGPLAFLILGAIGVGTLIFPWILPRIFFRRRRRRRSLSIKPQISESSLLFLKNLSNGYFDKYD